MTLTELIPHIIEWVHISRNELGLGMDLHNPNAVSTNLIKNGPIPLIINKMNFTVTSNINRCSGCLRAQLKFYKVPQGGTFTRTKIGGRVFQEVSLDPLAPTTVSIYPNSRKRVKVWIMITKCIATGALYGDILESLGRRSIVTFLQRMSYTTGVAPTVDTNNTNTLNDP